MLVKKSPDDARWLPLDWIPSYDGLVLFRTP